MKINPTPPIPVQGYLWMGRNIGIKDQSLDFGVLAAAHPCSAAAVFTRSNLPGAPVIVGREHAAKGTLQAIVVNSKCANVGLGEQGLQDARKMCQWTAEALKIQPELVLPASTGVIG
ncbi:MAG: bifunctional ornithine acetyltransferase/N-acetylglutamate synthase, partial [SAR324 cluster bacterium]|nr:bifunctional ornithine acetyltransferase/N-acetylglutamate synthase [SAR324 cluster bacterium]